MSLRCFNTVYFYCEARYLLLIQQGFLHSWQRKEQQLAEHLWWLQNWLVLPLRLQLRLQH